MNSKRKELIEIQATFKLIRQPKVYLCRSLESQRAKQKLCPETSTLKCPKMLPPQNVLKPSP